MRSYMCYVVTILWILTLNNGGLFLLSNGGTTSSFVRNEEKSIDMPLDSDVFKIPPGYNSPQQVHITQGDHVGKAVIVSWVTMDEPGSSMVVYWRQNGTQKNQSKGQIYTYKYYNYTSGYIHHCTIKNLEGAFGSQNRTGLDRTMLFEGAFGEVGTGTRLAVDQVQWD